MPVTFVAGDIFLSRAPVLGLSVNARGMAEVTPLATEFGYRYPAAFASFRKQVRTGRLTTGNWWVWREAKPWLALLVMRQSPMGATRVRYVDAIAQQIARDAVREQVAGLALAPLAPASEWPALREVLAYWLKLCPVPVVAYEQHRPGVQAEEPF